MSYFIILLVSSIMDVGSLGNPDYHTREAAEDRLKTASVFAVPALLIGRSSENPEIRFRVGELLPLWQELTLKQKAKNLLYSPFPVNYTWLWNRKELRDRIIRIAVADGGFVVSEEWIPGVEDVVNTQWYWTVEELQRNIEDARNQLGVTRVGWPF